MCVRLCRLWHQLTLKLQDMSALPYFHDSSNFLSLFTSFIQSNASKLNPVAYTTFAQLAASQQPSTAASLTFLAAIEPTVKDDPQARLMLDMERTRYRLKEGQVEESKVAVDEGKKALDSYAGVMAAEIYSIYYRTRCELALKVEDYNDYYSNALLFLTYTPMATLSETEKRQWALQLSLAALVGSKVYNFGELLNHSILQSLTSSPTNSWLPPFLATFNGGDMEQFNAGLFAAAEKQPVLASHTPFLQQKIRVMCLVDLVFRRPARERSFTFDEIARACQVERKDVEWLVMKAMALKVVKGSIDEVAGQVRIGWVQARVLDVGQIGVLRQRLGEWRKLVKEGELYIEQNAKEIITAVHI